MPVLHVRLSRLSNHASHLGLQHCSKPSISDRAHQFVECDRVQLTRTAEADGINVVIDLVCDVIDELPGVLLAVREDNHRLTDVASHRHEGVVAKVSWPSSTASPIEVTSDPAR